MSFSRDRLVRGAAAVSESAWLFAVLSVASVAMGLDGSALNWPSVLAILALSLLVARLTPGGVAAIEVVNLARTLVWAIVAYVAVAAHVGSGVGGVDLAWITLVGSESAPADFLPRAAGGSLMALLLLWRGFSIATSKDPLSTLRIGFRVGLPALALATAIDILHPADLNTLPMSFVFFASALGGLSVGHLMPESQESVKSRTWPMVLTAVIAAVLLIGFVAGLLQRGLQAFIAGPLATLLQGVFWAIVAPIFVLLDLFTGLIIAFFSRPFDPAAAGVPGFQGDGIATTTEPILAGPPPVLEDEQNYEVVGLLIQLVVSLSILALVAVVLLLLLAAFRRFGVPWGREDGGGVPDSIGEGADIASDIADLFRALVPDWRIGRKKRVAFELPDGPPGVVAALRIYYDLLAMAEEKGHVRRPNETATEFQTTMERIFPEGLVRMSTAAFNRACYGFLPATEEQISQMRSSLVSARASAGMAGRGQGFGISRPRYLR